uniref:Reverse transcriptase domain-containing protein n=1 Tax=Fagus sylvatica TaxID=28930 RepID=A0A2N9H0L2_FAGSY
MPPKRSTRQNLVANSHAEVESQGHSHAMGETHAQGGGQMHGGENPFVGGQAHGGEQVLGGGEIPLKEANANKEDHQNKNDNRNHEERESHNKNDTPFVTMSDVADLVKQERERPPKEPRHFVRRPPYPIELLKEPYPEKYDTPVFALFDGRKGSAMEHISKFLDSMGPFAAHGDLCLREFSKSLVDRAYTWYTVLPAGVHQNMGRHAPKQQIGEDLVKYIHRFRDVSLDCHVKYQEERTSREKPPFQSSLKLKRAGTRRVYRRLSLCPPQPHPVVPNERIQQTKPMRSHLHYLSRPEEMMAIFDKWVQDQVIKLPKISKQAHCRRSRKDPKYCRYHRYKNKQKVHQTPFPNYNKGKGKAVVSVVIHRNVSDMEAEESAAASSSLVPAAVRTLQKSPKFKSLFNQLGFGPEARNAATEALITIAAESGATCFTAEAHASHVQVRRALVDTGSCLNLIPLSTLQAVNLPQQKIQGSPMEVTGFGGVTEYTMGHVQLVLRVGPIVALTRFHVVNAETPYHVLLGRPWLHKHKLVSSTYHQCVKGRLNGKPIRIAANSCPFDQTEAHFVEAALYDDLASTGEPSILLERKKKRKEREVEHWESTTMRACPTPQWTHCLSLMKTENFGKVVVDQLQSTAMSSEEVTVDHAQSTVMNPQEVAMGQTKSMAINSERPAVDRMESMVVNSNEVLEDRAESATMSPEGSTVDHSRSTTSGLVAHSLNVEPGTRPVVQPMRTFHTEVEAQITQEIQPPVMPCFPSWTDLVATIKSACPPEMLKRLPFRTPIGNFYYTVMPFGLKNAGATYQRTMTAMFHDMMHKEIEDYVDDIVVKSKKREGSSWNLEERCLTDADFYKLKMNPLKCAFGVSAWKVSWASWSTTVELMLIQPRHLP